MDDFRNGLLVGLALNCLCGLLVYITMKAQNLRLRRECETCAEAVNELRARVARAEDTPAPRKRNRTMWDN